ncbi:unnamed protein product [Phytomonas sp. Hart1]|nr:unnamed protein product [Phytomonas sp. Hart1]|eukprot:CCW71659.1 unnamed protein product [Phytomonas sp. isolate Hart1]
MSSNLTDASRRMNKREGDLIDKMKTSTGGGVTAGGPPPPIGGKGYQSTQNTRQPAGGDFTRFPSPFPTDTTQQSTDNIRRALRISESTNATGYTTINSLGKQRDILQNTIDSVGETQGNLMESQAVIRSIRMGIYKEWLTKGCVIVALLALIVLIVWLKFIRK